MTRASDIGHVSVDEISEIGETELTKHSRRECNNRDFVSQTGRA